MLTPTSVVHYPAMAWLFTTESTKVTEGLTPFFLPFLFSVLSVSSVVQSSAWNAIHLKNPEEPLRYFLITFFCLFFFHGHSNLVGPLHHSGLFFTTEGTELTEGLRPFLYLFYLCALSVLCGSIPFWESDWPHALTKHGVLSKSMALVFSSFMPTLTSLVHFTTVVYFLPQRAQSSQRNYALFYIFLFSVLSVSSVVQFLFENPIDHSHWPSTELCLIQLSFNAHSNLGGTLHHSGLFFTTESTGIAYALHVPTDTISTWSSWHFTFPY